MDVSISFAIDWDHVCEAKADKRKRVKVSVSRGSLINGATKLILSSYFITSYIIRINISIWATAHLPLP